jgi:DDE superfamily endonuclease/Helix-turn-helix of DDE superfamily endonuclease
MYNTTGFTRDEIVELCAMVNAAELDSETQLWPPILGLFKSTVVALTYMRRNRVQAEIAESFGVSQPTVSRAVSVMTKIIKKVLSPYVPTADELDENAQYIIDGTLLPCWSWAARPELYSGKHKTTGMNIQVACNLAGRLAWISDPVDGRRHDSYCMDESGVLITMEPDNWAGDKGYVGHGMITPFKKPAGGELLDWQKEFNTQVNKFRYVIEQVIANFKTWRIMHTDYRRPIETFSTTISAVIALHFYKIA